MAKVHSAGILLYKFHDSGELMFFLAHPGGPFWKNKDEKSWSIPKGVTEDDEQDYIEVAKREFREEIGVELSSPLESLGAFKQPSGKVIHAWAGRQNIDPSLVVSNTFEMEWPPKSGNLQSFPEIDRADWFNYPTAKIKILKGQLPILEALIEKIDYDPSGDSPISDDGQISMF